MSGRLAPSTIAVVPHDPVLNWGELKRFGLDDTLAPPEAVFLDYAQTAWERYKTTIFVVSGILLAQGATIAALVVQGRRRQVAQREAAEQRLEVARLSRVSQLGALSGAITHELNQPLTAILANAEAGLRLLKQTPPDLQEVRDILGDIAEDDRRASKIISDLRSLMEGKRTRHDPVDINEVARDVVRLVESESLIRGVRLVLRFWPRPLVVLGDTDQIKQVILNLAMNGMDAMEEQPERSRLLTVETVRREDGWCTIAFEDEGRGLSGKVAEEAFRPFVSTKPNGLGMGLAICQTIAEAHRGTIGFEARDRGARVVFALPPR
jgi:C4-dicarboxylate-specific signal transduction histidine kinase